MAFQLDPNFTQAYNNWGVILINLGKEDETIEKFEETVRLNQNYLEAYQSLQLALENLGRYEDAVKLNLNLAEAYYKWGAALCDLGKYEETIEKLERAIKINPNYAQAHKFLGKIFMFYVHRKEEAKKQFLIALELYRKQGRDEDVKMVEELLKVLEGK